MASKLEQEIELKISAEKLWKNLKEFVTFFPKALPNYYEKIDVVEGDGSSVGTVFVSTFKPSEFNPVVMVAKERVDMVDEEKKTICYSFIEGDLMKNNYKSFKGIFSVSSTKSDGALVKFGIEFEKENAQVSDPHIFMAFLAKICQDMDAFLLKE